MTVARRKPAEKPTPRAVGSIRLRVIRGPDDEGRWYWRAERYRDGGRETVWTGWGSVDEADAAVAHVLVGDAPPTSDDCRTVRDLLSLWHGSIEDREDLARGTVEGYGGCAVRVRDTIGHVAVERIDRSAIERHRDASLRLGRTPRTVASDIRALRMAWRWGQEMGLVPVRELPRVPVLLPRLQRRRVSADEVAAALARMTGASRLHVLLLWSTGCRLAEIGALRWGDVEERGGRTWLRVMGKGRRPRSVPLPASAALELEAWRELVDHRPESTVLGRAPGSAKTLLHRDLDAAGVTWAPHDLRRAVVDRLYRAGVEVGSAAELLGHSAEVALRHYREASEADLVGAMDRAGLGGLPSAGDVIDLAHARTTTRTDPARIRTGGSS